MPDFWLRVLLWWVLPAATLALLIRRWLGTWRAYALAAAWTAVGLALLIGAGFCSAPGLFDTVGPSRNACVVNLQQIDDAKEQWATEHKKSPHDPADVAQINSYLKGGTAPSCPGGGVYAYNPVGVAPTCSRGPIDPDHILHSAAHFRALEQRARRAANLRVLPGLWVLGMVPAVVIAVVVRGRQVKRPKP